MAKNLNETPNANRTHISFFGKRNAGKSSVVNAVTGQELSIVSDVKGTTTDPVYKAMELLPLGPVVIIDTPGIDDNGLVGEMRVRKAKQVLNKTDIAILVIDSSLGKSHEDEELINLFVQKEIPYITVYNKSDLKNQSDFSENEIEVSAINGSGVFELKEKIAHSVKSDSDEKTIFADIIDKNDIVILVTPIDSSAPKGRMILPQVQAIRDILDKNAVCFVTQTEQLPVVLDSLKQKPKMVVTDSQAFEKVKKIVSNDIKLTSFSVLFARYKGFLDVAVKGVNKLDDLKDGDKILISEGCTHHRQCEDIGTVKLPKWIESYTKKSFQFEFTSGGEFPEELSQYSLIVHCGGCMLNERELRYRQKCATDQNVHFTNYGTIIAKMNGILERSLQIFKK